MLYLTNKRLILLKTWAYLGSSFKDIYINSNSVENYDILKINYDLYVIFYDNWNKNIYIYKYDT